MKSIIIIIFIIGLIFLVSGYIKTNFKCPGPKIEYRYVPQTFYNEQTSKTDLKKLYGNMFNQTSVWQTYPLNNSIDINKTENTKNFFKIIDK